jgi:hypothetical protein
MKPTPSSDLRYEPSAPYSFIPNGTGYMFATAYPPSANGTIAPDMAGNGLKDPELPGSSASTIHVGVVTAATESAGSMSSEERRAKHVANILTSCC